MATGNDSVLTAWQVLGKHSNDIRAGHKCICDYWRIWYNFLFCYQLHWVSPQCSHWYLRGPASRPKGSNDTYSLHADLHCKKYEAKFAMITYSCVVCSGLKVIHIVQKTKNTQCNEIVLYNSRLIWTALKLPFLIILGFHRHAIKKNNSKTI